jgi:hypothetical protein
MSIENRGPENKSDGIWEKDVAEFEKARDEAFASYFRARKQTDVEISRRVVAGEFMSACNDFANTLLRDVTIARTSQNPASSKEQARDGLNKHVAWHVLIGSTPRSKESPHRDINDGQIRTFFEKIKRTGTLPERE